MLDPYERLAETLNRIPNGFTPTEEGTHLKLLRWIFTEEEADLASKMKLIAETVEELSSRLNLPLEGLKEKLETMVSKGQIHVMNTSTGRRYGLMPYAVGIYEEQLGRMDKEFAEITEEHLQKSAGKDELFETEPSIFRVVPIKQVIDPELEIFPYESAEEIISNAKSWGVRDCICKEQQELLGKPCKYPKTVCLLFSSREDAFIESKITQTITKEQALEYLREAKEAGLIHCTMNIKSGHYYICNCCTCCCGVLRGLTQRNQPRAFVKSNFIMKVDEELCTGCETCVDRCQFDALKVPDGICEVDHERCVGCGVCAISCPEEALTLVSKDSTQTEEPPDTLKDWMTQKAMSRQVDPSDLL